MLDSGTIVTASMAGLSLVPYIGVDADRLTLSGEINKLASNIGVGARFCGNSLALKSPERVLLGEAVALSVPRGQSENYVGRISKASRSPSLTKRSSRSEGLRGRSPLVLGKFSNA
jgi:hypothetical protein